MIFFKACPRCRGDIELASDPYGGYVKCLQCGFTRDVPDTRSIMAQTAARVRELQRAS
ncbi:MAG: hypothetical protein V3S18_07065 [Dehalococcoidia bacterium]